MKSWVKEDVEKLHRMNQEKREISDTLSMSKTQKSIQLKDFRAASIREHRFKSVREAKAERLIQQECAETKRQI